MNVKPTVQTKWAEMSASLKTAMGDFVRGDASAFRRHWSLAADVVIMGGFGGYEVGGDTVQKRLQWAAEQYAGGEIELDHLASFIGSDLACTVTIEHSSGIAGAPDRTMDLRVTQVFRLEEGNWRLVHRHADPLRPTAAP